MDDIRWKCFAFGMPQEGPLKTALMNCESINWIIKWNHLAAFACIIGAACFIFLPKG